MAVPGMQAPRRPAALARSVLAVLPLLFLLFPLSSSAGERGGRPWGGHYTPPIDANGSTRQKGYLGRYNPWGAKQGEEAVEESPRYRQRDGERERSRARRRPYDYRDGYPRPYGQPPAGRAVDRGYTPWGNDYTYPSPAAPYSGYTPWGDGRNSYYGGQFNGPYNGLQPDTGVLWSDMWRW
jgi:hypothetical protein